MDTKLVEVMEERLRQAMLKSDLQALDEILSPELSFTTFLGQVISKKDDLDAHASGLLAMHSIELSDSVIRNLGNVALVSCAASIDASFDDDRSHRTFRFSRVWVEESEGKLQLISGQATLVFDPSDV